MEAAIDYVIRIADCDREEARDALVHAILDGEIRSRFGDNGLEEIKAFLWGNARHWAPYSGFSARNPNRVRISGDAAYLRPYFDPPPDPSLLPERMRPVEVRREDLQRLWPSPPVVAEPRGLLPHTADKMEVSDTEEQLARKWKAQKWRRQWIAKFAERQRAAGRWIAIADLVDWCSHSTTIASIEAEAKAREVAYQRLTDAVQKDEFEREGRSKVLFLDALATSDGASPRCRLTREQFEIAVDAAAAPPAPSVPVTVLNCCWLPSDLARKWLEAHGYRLPPYLESRQAVGEVVDNRGGAGRASQLHNRQSSGASTSSSATPHRFDNPVWEFGDILGWLMDRNQRNFGRFWTQDDFRSEFYIRAVLKSGVPLPIANPRRALLHALQRGQLTAYRQGNRIDKAEWFAKTETDILNGIRAFAVERDEVLKLWRPSDQPVTVIAAQSAGDDQRPLPALPLGYRTNRAEDAEGACEAFLREMTTRPENKEAAFEAARNHCGEALSRKAFDRVWAKAAPTAWKQAGRPSKRKS
jgi:hypothetical protein